MTVVIGFLFLSVAPRAQASVVVGDTFNIAVIACPTTAGTNCFYIVNPLTANFGSVQAFVGAGANGQTVTVSSSEVVGTTLTTDSFLISVPTNFDPSTVEKLMEADLGGYNAGSDAVDFAAPILPASFSLSGSMQYSGGTLALAPGSSLFNNNQSVKLYEGVQTSGSSLSVFNIQQFNFSVSYDNPVSVTPEPASLALLGTGMAAIFGLRRRKAQIG